MHGSLNVKAAAKAEGCPPSAPCRAHARSLQARQPEWSGHGKRCGRDLSKGRVFLETTRDPPRSREVPGCTRKWLMSDTLLQTKTAPVDPGRFMSRANIGCRRRRLGQLRALAIPAPRPLRIALSIALRSIPMSRSISSDMPVNAILAFLRSWAAMSCRMRPVHSPNIFSSIHESG
jgi:hypothetical protein